MSDPGATILLVDDDDDYAAAIGSFLAAHGYCVLRARDGREGLRLARSAHPGLVLMDVMMEERTAGFFAIQELRRDPELASIPVFVVSSIYSAIPGFRVSPDAGWLRHDGFLAKPVDLEELLARVRERLPAGGRPAAPAPEVVAP
jgi:DNA-binding response OmpR family regulator